MFICQTCGRQDTLEIKLVKTCPLEHCNYPKASEIISSLNSAKSLAHAQKQVILAKSKPILLYSSDGKGREVIGRILDIPSVNCIQLDIRYGNGNNIYHLDQKTKEAICKASSHYNGQVIVSGEGTNSAKIQLYINGKNRTILGDGKIFEEIMQELKKNPQYPLKNFVLLCCWAGILDNSIKKDSFIYKFVNKYKIDTYGPVGTVCRELGGISVSSGVGSFSSLGGITVSAENSKTQWNSLIRDDRAFRLVQESEESRYIRITSSRRTQPYYNPSYV